MSTAEAESEFNGLLPQFRVMRDERTIYERWREVVSDHDVKGKQVHDARIVAAMLRHNMSHLLTFNASDFTRYSAVAIVEPHQASALGPAE